MIFTIARSLYWTHLKLLPFFQKDDVKVNVPVRINVEPTTIPTNPTDPTIRKFCTRWRGMCCIFSFKNVCLLLLLVFCLFFLFFSFFLRLYSLYRCPPFRLTFKSCRILTKILITCRQAGLFWYRLDLHCFRLVPNTDIFLINYLQVVLKDWWNKN